MVKGHWLLMMLASHDHTAWDKLNPLSGNTENPFLIRLYAFNKIKENFHNINGGVASIFAKPFDHPPGMDENHADPIAFSRRDPPCR